MQQAQKAPRRGKGAALYRNFIDLFLNNCDFVALKCAHMINKAVLWKCEVERGADRDYGWRWWWWQRGRGGDVAMAFKGTGMFGWHGPPPAPLPLFMCHSLSRSL